MLSHHKKYSRQAFWLTVLQLIRNSFVLSTYSSLLCLCISRKYFSYGQYSTLPTLLACIYSTVEWSSYEDFIPLTGEAVLDDLRHMELEMKGLNKGCRYYVRVSASNVKGYGGFTLATPQFAVASSKFISIS